MADTDTSTTATHPLSARDDRRWRHSYAPEERRRILRTVFLDWSDGWAVRFSVMMICSVVIASLGLLSSSAAIVIGAMLIAPLMTPMQGVAVALAMGWARRLVTPAATILGATFGSIGLAFLVSALIPDPDAGALPAELLARTAPDLRDLLVALGAGAAGAYATAREDVSAALPGVAVAVALVPPLSTVGITLQLDRPDLAAGAFLLYASNLVAIVGAAVVVLLLTGFVPLPRLAAVKPRVAAALAAIGAGILLVAIPLTTTLVDATNRGRARLRVTELVAAWLGSSSSLSIVGTSIDESLVVVDLAGPDSPPPVRGLADRIGEVLGEAVRVEVRWALRSATVTAVGDGADGASLDPTSVRPVVLDWLREDGAARTLRLTGLGVQGTLVTVDIAGPDEPPAAELLRLRLTKAVGAPERVDVRWTQQREFTAAAGAEQKTERSHALDVATKWLGMRGRVVGVELSQTSAVVAVAGPEAPTGVAELTDRLSDRLGRRVDATVRWTAERTLTPDDDRLTAFTNAARTHAAAWLGRAPRNEVAAVDITARNGGYGVVVDVRGPDAPPAAEPLADALAAAGEGPVDLEIAWRGPSGLTSSALFGLPDTHSQTVSADLLFAPGSTRLRPQARDTLAQVAERLRREHAGKRVIVAGHTDSVGSDASNLRLARRRAEAVRAWLIEAGWDAGSIATRSYGESRPVASNVHDDGRDNPDGRARNRRVEVLAER